MLHLNVTETDLFLCIKTHVALLTKKGIEYKYHVIFFFLLLFDHHGLGLSVETHTVEMHYFPFPMFIPSFQEHLLS